MTRVSRFPSHAGLADDLAVRVKELKKGMVLSFTVGAGPDGRSVALRVSLPPLKDRGGGAVVGQSRGAALVAEAREDVLSKIESSEASRVFVGWLIVSC